MAGVQCHHVMPGAGPVMLPSSDAALSLVESSGGQATLGTLGRAVIGRELETLVTSCYWSPPGHP